MDGIRLAFVEAALAWIGLPLFEVHALRYGMHPYEELDAWRECHKVVLAVYSATAGWPVHERYGLSSQIRRAAFSTAANIVEGRARRGRKEFRRFLGISWASLAEVEYTLRLARDLGYLSPSDHERIQLFCRTAAKPLYGLLRSMGDP